MPSYGELPPGVFRSGFDGSLTSASTKFDPLVIRDRVVHKKKYVCVRTDNNIKTREISHHNTRNSVSLLQGTACYSPVQ